MDQQGTPIGFSAPGKKNTTDPEAYQKPKEEGAGVITDDSLAAESARSGGAFSENKRNADISESSFNPADTDVSDATTLPPTQDTAGRLDKDHRETSDDGKGPGGQKYPEGTDGQGEFPGTHSATGYVGGSTRAKQELGIKTKGAKPQSTGAENTKGSVGKDTDGAHDHNRSKNVSGNTTENTGTIATESSNQTSQSTPAPTYINPVISHPPQSLKPKGTNISEGDFEDDPSKNVSFTADVGSENDPGRLAVHTFLLETQAAAGGGGPRKGGETGKGEFGVLDEEEIV